MKEGIQTNKQKAKCKYCEESIPKGEGIKHGGRYYHPDCLEEYRKQVDDRASLIEYVCNLLDLEKPTGLILMQIKRFHEEFGYTYKGMELTLKYFYEILDNEVREGDGIGIIPYVYEDATQQYIRQRKINESARNKENHKRVERVVYISPRSKTKKKKLIEIDDLV